MVLDVSGNRMSDYRVQVSSEELITKSVFDSVQSLEHLIAHAEEFNVDVHRIILLGSSAGTAEINYLAWVHHQWNVARFTPLGMVLANPQFDLPVQAPLDIFGHFEHHMEPRTMTLETHNSALLGLDAWNRRNVKIIRITCRSQMQNKSIIIRCMFFLSLPILK